MSSSPNTTFVPPAASAPTATNPLFPVFLKLEQLQTLVVGGGNVGLEKLSAVLANSPQAQVVLVAPEIRPEIEELATKHPFVTLVKREFREEDLTGKDIVLVATNDNVLNITIRDLAKSHKILTNVADTPLQCDFYLGSIVQKGSLKLAISTNGKSPTIAKRLKQVLNEGLPDEMEQVLDKMTQLRATLKGDFAYKVKRLNEATEVLVEPPVTPSLATVKKKKQSKYSLKVVLMLVFAALSLMVTGHLLFSYIPFSTIGAVAMDVAAQVDREILIFILAGFVAQLIDGALGMAYGVSATTFLLSFGVSPVAASASVHASEIFTSGVSGWMHLKFGNVNSKLFKTIVFPGVLGAIAGAFLLYTLEEYLYLVKPIVACYTLFLGILIIRKVLKKHVKKSPVKRLGMLGAVGGFLDAIGGGGWGPIVSSTLIAKGRHPMYTVGSVNLAEFFVSFASSAAFISLIGITHWQIIIGLILGGTIAAPLGAMLARRLPVKTMMIIVGIVVIIVSLRLIFMAFFL
ncbi:siroheme synthase [Pontibacter diazotrophicus]|uniref:Probable membrane transporter protein n=1 Tax=Pontibacter diazotrophicus TaxID=1400979 RepID=A0A3D8LFG2_9BACT|nr:TSUP family transporter [Pontibacter diazotrophicus]RDV16181.1 siroheme synthase [Pontibacter diazotrophicus]